VFRAFTQGYEQNLRGDVQVAAESRQQWSALLRRLAWVMMQSPDAQKPTEFRVAIGRSDVERIFTDFLQPYDPYPARLANQCLNDLLKHHLIQTNGEQIEFRHQLIQEYYAAECLLEQLPSLDEGVLRREYLNYLKWTEPLALMLGLVANEEQALRVVRSGLEVDLMLGARLAGKVRDELQETVVSLIAMMDIPPDLRVRCLRETGAAAAVLELIKAVEDKASYVRWETPRLDKNLEFRWQAVFALGELGYKAAIPVLQRLQKHENWDIQYQASEALEKIYGTSKQEDENSAHKDVARVLKTEILELMSMLDDNNFSVRRNAIEELGGLGKEATIAIPKIIKMLNMYPDQPIAAIALGRLGCRSVVPDLLQMLRSTDRFSQMGAALALGDLGVKNTVPILLETLQDGDSKVRSYVASALGMLGTEQAMLGLLKALEDDYPDVRWNAARSLTKLEEAFLPSLLPSLRHRCYHIGGDEVIEAIASIQSRCQYYNHELEEERKAIAQSIPNPTAPNSSPNVTMIFEAPVYGAVGNIEGNQVIHPDSPNP
jgi:HEAT repeat protein